MIESVDSTYVIIRGVKTSDNSLGDDVYLSFQDGTLLSYKEDLASENGQEYGITLELLDPDGVFISKMYSYVLNQYKHFFTNLNVDYTASGQITALGDTKYRELVAQYVRDNPGRIVRSNGFTTFDLEGLEGYDYSTGLMDDGSDPFTIPLTLDDVESMSVNQINNIITGATEEGSFVPFINNEGPRQELESLYGDEVDLLNKERVFQVQKDLVGLIEKLDLVGLNQRLYINIGVGDRLRSGSNKNETGYREFEIKRLFMNQDSGKDHLVTLELAPGNAFSDMTQGSETDESRDTDKFFPTDDDSFDKIVLLKGKYNNVPRPQTPGATIDASAAFTALSQIEINNLPNIVSLMERLLQQYLHGDSYIPVVYINPVIESKLKEKINPQNLNETGAKVIGPLTKILNSCGFRVTCNMKETGTLIENEFLRNFVAFNTGRVLDADVKKDYDFEYYLQFAPPQNMTKGEAVLEALRSLEKELNVFPRGVDAFYIENVEHKKLFARKQFEPKPVDDEIYRNYYVQSSNFGAAAGNINLPAIAGVTSAARRARDRYNVKEVSLYQLTKEEIEQGNIPNFLVIGDDFLIRSLIFPFDPEFSRGVFEQYANKVKEKMSGVIGEAVFTYCNAYKFLYDPILFEEGGYLRYLEQYSEKVGKFNTYDYDENTLVPDEYAFALEEDKQGTVFSQFKGRVYIAGEQHSNVISVTTRQENIAFGKFNEFYSLTSKAGIKTAKKAVENRGYVTDRLPEGNQTRTVQFTESEVEDIVNEVNKSVTSNIAIESAVQALAGQNATDVIKTIQKKVVESFLQSPNVKSKRISKEGFAAYLDFLQKVSDEARSIIIKIKPDFRISSVGVISQPAFFFHSNPYITSSRSSVSNLSLLSGLYRIVGYNHVINSSEAYTQVVLLRDPFTDSINFQANNIGA